MWYRWAWSPRKASRQRSLTTFRGAGPTGNMVTSQPWALGGRRQVSGWEEESGDTQRCLTRSRCLSVEDLSLEQLLWRMPLSARFDPALRWACNISRLSEGLSCRSESGPMFADGTAGPMVGWGGPSPTNCWLGEGISVSGRARMAGGGTGVGPPGKDPGKRPVGPGSPVRAAGVVAGWYALTTEVVTAEPHPGHTQSEGGAA